MRKRPWAISEAHATLANARTVAPDEEFSVASSIAGVLRCAFLGAPLLPLLLWEPCPAGVPELRLDPLMPLFYAACSALGFLLLARAVFGPNKFIGVGRQVATILLASTIGLLLVLAVQRLGKAASGWWIVAGSNTSGGVMLPFYFVKLTAFAYDVLNTVSDFPPAVVFGFTFGVALTEETIKAFIASSVLGTLEDVSVGWKSLAHLGFLGGVGFGIGEGVWYVFTEYIPSGAPWTAYAIRFASCVALHGIWTSLVFMGGLGPYAAIGLHATYNSCLAFDRADAAQATAVVSAVLLCALILAEYVRAGLARRGSVSVPRWRVALLRVLSGAAAVVLFPLGVTGLLASLGGLLSAVWLLLALFQWRLMTESGLMDPRLLSIPHVKTVAACAGGFAVVSYLVGDYLMSVARACVRQAFPGRH